RRILAAIPDHAEGFHTAFCGSEAMVVAIWETHFDSHCSTHPSHSPERGRAERSAGIRTQFARFARPIADGVRHTIGQRAKSAGFTRRDRFRSIFHLLQFLSCYLSAPAGIALFQTWH